MRNISGVTVVSSKGQVVIPKGIRDALGLRAGDQLEVALEGHRLVLRAMSKTLKEWRTLEGAFGPADQTTAQILAEGRAEEFLRERAT
ncbi:MAG: AbrB/MazE/SpoVT family DNA-binding domain-containing protein [Acidobacteria bacterium]|jgi:AbrB family looped-hinge helix DNA binding protein|nr:AbrB/MazE/SpoVT family DNA-binding domain-containing protein [Acidobacteriota bacterium]